MDRIAVSYFSESFAARLFAWLLLLAAALLAISHAHAALPPYLPTPPIMADTTGTNGDVNPYGVAFVPTGFATGSGTLAVGDILVSNFNNSANLQGTGITIVDVKPDGTVNPFFTVPHATPGGAGTGLTTALAVFRKGFIIVGSIPSANGQVTDAAAGSLLVLDAAGNLVTTITDATIDGPWDMTAVDAGNRAMLFVSNAFAGTVVRIDLLFSANSVTVESKTVIATGYGHQSDPVTFVDGPTGLVYDSATGILYVASTVDNAVYAVPGAAAARRSVTKGRLIYSDSTHLHGALAMAEAPNGDLLVTNNDDINSDPTQPSEIVEFTKRGEFVKELSVDPAQGGSFGLAVSTDARTQTSILAAVDDNAPSLLIYTLPFP